MRNNIARTVGGSLMILGVGVSLAACGAAQTPVALASHPTTTTSTSTAAATSTGTPTAVTPSVPATSANAPVTAPPASGGTVSGASNQTSGGAPVYVEENTPTPPVQKPSEYDFYEYTEMNGIHWTGWGSSTATGTGTLEDNNCSPNCATGYYNKFQATVVLSDIQTVNGRPEYTKYTVTFQGQAQWPDLARSLTNQHTGSNP